MAVEQVLVGTWKSITTAGDEVFQARGPVAIAKADAEPKDTTDAFHLAMGESIVLTGGTVFFTSLSQSGGSLFHMGL